jgi:NAD(P)H-flavin reductase/ferredoxin
MAKICTLEVNGEAVSVQRGDLLLDAALSGGIDIPHDCRSGHCGTCRVRVVEGRVFGGATGDPDTVYACQSRIVSDLRVAVEDVPEFVSVPGIVSSIAELSSDVCEVCVDTQEPVDYIPGQYCSVQFRGYPARCFSPTAPLDWPCQPAGMRFHIRKVRGGRVTPALGTRVRAGHQVRVEGPFGSACLRPFPSQRLVLVASGTGFAPIWSIAEAAIRSHPHRELVLVAGARTLETLYMIPALCRLAPFPNVTIIPVVAQHQDVTSAVHCGRPADHLPALAANDVVFVAGAPAMVDEVAGMARAAGARCYSDPFEPTGPRDSLWSRAASGVLQQARQLYGVR